MTTVIQPRPARPPSRATAAAYARLAKLDITDYYLSAAVAWALLPAGERFAGRALLTLGLFLASEVCLIAAMVTLDDVTGYRDGSDAANYGPDAPARRLARKPLLAGTLTEGQAIRFAWVTAAAGALLWLASMLAAPHHPRWVLITGIAYLVLCVQYSWGLKLSYRGGQELFLAGLGVVLVILPYGMLTGTADGFALLQATLFGLGPLLFGVYSNTNDVAGDKLVGRLVAATVLSPRGNKNFIRAVSGIETALIIGAALGGLAPWWFPIVMLPVIGLRAGQLLTGLHRGDILRARRIGIRAHRVTAATLVAVDLIIPVLSKGAL
jgi:1,4-dihydroxy-2-naphthoate octaprenyltransferase